MQTNSPLQSHSTRGYTAALAAAVFLSTTAIFIRYLTLNFQIPALVLAFWRALFVTLTLLPVLTFSRRVDVRSGLAHSKYLVVYGLVLALFNSMWTLSVALNGAAVATVMAYSSAAFTVLLGWWLLKESLTPVKLVAVVFSLAGCFLVSGALDASVQLNPGGILAGILSGLGYAAYSLMGRSAAGRGLNPWVTLLYTFAFASLFLLAFNLLGGGVLPGAAPHPADLGWLGSAWQGWLALILLAAGPTVAGFGLYNVALSHLPSSIANLIVTLEPIFTAIVAYLLFGEQLTGLQILGGLLILGGVASLRGYDLWQARRERLATGKQGLDS
jgi:drug/metabolite transporter (DMT)-like permease